MSSAGNTQVPVPWIYRMQSNGVSLAYFEGDIEIGGNLTVAGTIIGVMGIFPTVAVFEAATIPDTVTSVQVAGYFTPGDGGAAMYALSGTPGPAPGMVETADGKWWIIASGQTINLRQFGATFDGATDDRDAIQAALDFAAEFGPATVYAPVAGTGLKAIVDSTLVIDACLVSLDLAGATLDFSGIAVGSAFEFDQSTIDVNLRTSQNYAHVLKNGVIIGPGGVAGTRALDIFNGDSPPLIAGLAFDNLSFINWDQDCRFGDGAFCVTFNHCSFTFLSGGPSGVVYSMSLLTAAANGGEKIAFNDCQWFNRPYLLGVSNPNCDIFFTGCSLDYFGARAITQTGAARVFLTNCHIENRDDTADWFSLGSDPNGVLSLVNCNIICDEPLLNFSVFRIDNACRSGGLFLKSCGVSIDVGHQTPLVAGTSGRVVIDDLTWLANTAYICNGETSNMLAYGGFENAAYASDWTFAGTSPPVRSNARAHTGTWSLNFPATSTNTPVAARAIDCIPGKKLFCEFWYQTVNLAGTSATFQVTCAFRDKDGNILESGNTIAVTTDVGTWTRDALFIANGAPRGTVSALVTFQVSGAASGAPQAYIDDVIINVS